MEVNLLLVLGIFQTLVRGYRLFLLADHLTGDNYLLWLQWMLRGDMVEDRSAVAVLHRAVRALHKFEKICLQMGKELRELREFGAAIEARKD